MKNISLLLLLTLAAAIPFFSNGKFPVFQEAVPEFSTDKASPLSSLFRLDKFEIINPESLSGFVLNHAQNSQPYQHAETRQVVTLVNEAAELVKTKGESAFGEFKVQGSKWRKGLTYIIVLDPKGNMLVHQDQKLEGKNQLNLKDINGKPFIKGLLAVAQTPGKPDGWYHYQWTAPGSTKPLWKSTYARLVKAPSGKSYVVASGIYTNYMEKAFVVDAVENAVAEIEKRGEAAFPLLKDPAGPYRAKDAYMIAITSEGVEKVNPAFPQYVGKNVLNVKDSQGKPMIREILEMAKNKNGGWVDYMWPKPGEKTSSKKSTYIRKAKLGNDWIAVGCGVYLD